MKRILLVLKKTVRQSILMVCAIALMGLGLLISPTQPVYAGLGFNINPIEKGSKINNKSLENPTSANREEAYEEAIKEAQTPQAVEKTYEQDLQVYKEAHPGPGIVETAEKLVEKVVAGEDPILENQ